MMNYSNLLEPILTFLPCRTPDAWIEQARNPENLSLLLTDHMVCELKAAQTATWLIRNYVADKASGETILRWLAPYENFIYRQASCDDFIAAHKSLSRTVVIGKPSPWSDQLINKMMLLIKEELHHFFQVWELMQKRGFPYQKITASRYAKGLLAAVTTYEPFTMVDKLICGAYIEARSCERFAALAPWLDPELERFYLSLLRSEARHYQDYLELASLISPVDINQRVRQIGRTEARLICEPDVELRFHSGPPVLIQKN